MTAPTEQITHFEDFEEQAEAHVFIVNAIRIGMIFGPSIGYFAQMREIMVTHNCDGFAPVLSLILLGSNTLRVYYWIGAQFDIALLLQALVMLCVQCGLVYVVLKAQIHVATVMAASPTSNSEGNGTNITVTDYGDMVRTPHQVFKKAGCADALLFSPFPSDFKTMTPALFAAKFTTMALIFGLITAIIYNIFGWEAAGYVGCAALCVEGCLYLPQIQLNYSRRSTEGLTWVLLCTWVGGDIAKLLYFIFDHQPLPFVVCSCFQLTCDAVMLTQVFLYRNNKKHCVIATGGASAVPTDAAAVSVAEMRNFSNAMGGNNNNNNNSSDQNSMGGGGVGLGNNNNNNTNKDVIVSRGSPLYK